MTRRISPSPLAVRDLRRFVLSMCLIVGARLDAADGPPSFDDVRPLLASKCVACHGPEKQEGGLRLDSAVAARTGGDQGPAIVPGNVEASLLAKAISFRDPDLQMPPKQRLADREIEMLTAWVAAGAAWPEPVVALFEDDSRFPELLTNGNGRGRLTADNVHSGKVALAMTPLQRDAVSIPGWNFPIREIPGAGEYRYLRLAWRKQGEGSIMLELGLNGRWPDAGSAPGRYVAGPNTTGWAAVSVGKTAPTDWTVMTFDLWQDIGDFTLTGCAPTCDRGEEAFFDAMVLGPSLDALDAYHPESPLALIPGDSSRPSASPSPADLGDAFSDERNPIRRLFGEERLGLWSLRPPQSSERRLDDQVRERLARDGLELAPEADPRTLLRRLTFDLTGLPPTPDEATAFVAEYAAEPTGAYSRLVDRLLDSPRYGERQARLWLDVVRYADTNGYERDEFRPLIWQYRDYVVRSFGQDKPFDRFIREQLAGDELVKLRQAGREERVGPVSDEDLLVATGYLRLGQWDSTASIFQEEERLRAEVLADLTNTTASAFLGLTMSCCQCHDHKYDPFSQADHFRLRAFFAGIEDRNDTVISSPAELAEIQAHNDGLDAEAAPLRREQAAMLDAARERISAERLEKLSEELQQALALDPANRDEETRKKLEPILEGLKVNDDDARAALNEADRQRETLLVRMIADLDGRKRQPRKAMTAADAGAAPPAIRILYQGDHASPREEVAPGYPAVFTPGPAQIVPPAADSTGRRLALADWIASANNPWTARVIVNRIWQQHFGTGLAATANDFGLIGAGPILPELLDALAIEFVQDGWSIKRLHRRIVTSATYRQSSRASFPLPGLSQTVRRLDAETLLDSLLSVSGLLRPYASGRPLWPPVSEELRHAQPAILEAEKGGDGGRMQGWYADPLEETRVRSLFLVRKRCLPIPFLQVFDLPETTVSCARRDSTVVAPQALMLLNGDEAIKAAQALSERLLQGTPEPDFDEVTQSSRLVDALFMTALSRAATVEEQGLAQEFLTRHRREHERLGRGADAEKRALTDLCRAVLNLNEFAYID